MTFVPQKVYEANASQIFDWFSGNVFYATDYTILPLDKLHDYRHTCDLQDLLTGTIDYRVLINVTYEDVSKMQPPVKLHKDLVKFEIPSPHAITAVINWQVCVIQLDQKSNKPVGYRLANYSRLLGTYTLLP